MIFEQIVMPELQVAKKIIKTKNKTDEFCPLIQPIGIIPENFSNHIRGDFFLRILTKVEDLINKLFSGHVPECAEFFLLIA